MAKLLFVNTFCHDAIEEFNIDYVKFSSGALATVREIRIIPRGAKIPVAESPQRQGMTSPNSFSLEVFAKNFNRPDASVFDRIAVIDYHFDLDISFPVRGFTTDGVLFRGKYTTLTVAIYGDPVSGDSTEPSMPFISTTTATLAAPILQQPSPVNTFATPADAGQGLLAVFAGQPPPTAQLLPPVGAPIPTWVGATPTVPPVPYNPLVPPPMSVMASYPTTPSGGPNVFVATGQSVVPVPFDPTRPPPAFHTPQHSPQLMAQQQISPPVDQRPQQTLHSSRRRHEPSSRTKRSSTESRYQMEAKPIEAIGNVKPVVSSINAAAHVGQRGKSGSLDEIQLEDGEYARSDGDMSEKFDLENISEDEFEFDDSMAAELNDHDLQEDLLVNVRFNPYRFTIAPLKYFKDPSLSQCELELLSYYEKRNMEGGGDEKMIMG